MVFVCVCVGVRRELSLRANTHTYAELVDLKPSESSEATHVHACQLFERAAVGVRLKGLGKGPRVQGCVRARTKI